MQEVMRRMPGQMKSNGVWVGAALVLVLYVTFFGYQTIKSYQGQEQLHEFRNGMTRFKNSGEIQQLLQSERFSLLELRKPEDDPWVVSTPTRFGAGNWILQLEFVDSALVALRVRTEDSSEFHPSDAPPDIIWER